MKLLTAFVATASLMASTGVAGATTLYSPLLWSDGSPNLHDCQVLNVSSATIAVTVAIINYQGTIEFESTFGVGPGLGGGVAAIGSAQAYCRIDYEGSKNAIRASLCVRPPASNCQAAVEAH